MKQAADGSAGPGALAALPVVLSLLLAPLASAEPLSLVPIAENMMRPLGVEHAGDGSGRLFILQQNGLVLIHDGSELLAEPFLDLRSKTICCDGASGLLALAFHPDYRKNGYFYVSYMDKRERSVISRFSVSADPDRADRRSEEVLLRLPQPRLSHNLAPLVFGPDGYLYIGSGDGGCCGDPFATGQDLTTLLGKILRIDVDGDPPYAIPPDNPFVDQAGVRPEIWAYGLRSPWRLTFDRKTGDMFIADVGNSSWEEINLQPADSPGGENYGWSRMEGPDCFNPPEGCDTSGITLPVLQYAHEHAHEGEEAGCASIIGGYRYRGPAAPTLGGLYVFGDLCSGEIWGARRNAAGNWVANELAHSELRISSFGEDERGRLYVVDIVGDTVYRLVGGYTFATDFEHGLAGWSKRRGRLKITAPGLRGSTSALEVPLAGPRKWWSVRSNHPSSETTFQLSFDFNANRADLAGTPVDIVRLLGGPTRARVVLEATGSAYRVALWVNDAAGLRRVGGGNIPAGATVNLKLKWMRASAEGVADGEAVLIRNGKTVARATDLDNHDQTVGAVLLGLPRGSGAGSSGSLLFDNYRSSP